MAMNINGKKHASLREVAEVLGVTTGRLRQLCIAGRITGALKTPTDAWYIPLPPRILSDGRVGRKIVMKSA